MAKELLSKGTKLSFKKSGESDYTNLTGLKATPDFGAESEKIEVTDLSDSNKRYIDGIGDYGDSLEYTFNYESKDGSSYYLLKELETSKEVVSFKQEYADGLTFIFDGQVTTKFSGSEVNNALEFTASITVNSNVAMTKPTFS